jgi:hypothetical protein
LDSEGEIREGELEDDGVTAEEVAVSLEGAPGPGLDGEAELDSEGVG